MTPNAAPPLMAALLLVSPVALCVVRMREERTLWLGFWALVAAASVVGLLELGLLSIPGAEESPQVRFLCVALAVMLVVALLAFPVVLAVTLLVSGVRLVRREGARPSNLLSLGLGVAMVAYVTAWPAIRRGLEGLPLVGDAFDLLFSVVAVPVGLAGAAFALYTASGLVAQVPHPRRRYRYIVALGSGLAQGRHVTPLLARRVDRAIRAWRETPAPPSSCPAGRVRTRSSPRPAPCATTPLGRASPTARSFARSALATPARTSRSRVTSSVGTTRRVPRVPRARRTRRSRVASSS